MAAPLKTTLPTSRPTFKRSPIEIVAIGSSTGGPEALATLFLKFQQKLPVPIVIAQHMPAMFTQLLAERLQSLAPSLKVREAKAGDVLAPGGVWIAPGNFHMELRSQGISVEISLNQHPPINSSRPSVDVLFKSVAEIYKSGCLAVILTGMGRDGLDGCHEIYGRGGRIIAQDEATSIVWGMPGRVAKAGIADKTLPIEEIGLEILRRVTR